MKRRFKLIVALITVFTFYGRSQVNYTPFDEKAIAIDSFNHLVIKSNLRVVLIESERTDSARIEGIKDFADKVLIVRSGNRLIVRANSFKDLKKEGTIYIPVKSLRSIEVHDDAKVISYSIIRSPQLDLLIEGNCTVSIILKGKLNILKGEDYNYSFKRIYENSNTPTYQQSIFNH